MQMEVEAAWLYLQACGDGSFPPPAISRHNDSPEAERSFWHSRVVTIHHKLTAHTYPGCHCHFRCCRLSFPECSHCPIKPFYRESPRYVQHGTWSNAKPQQKNILRTLQVSPKLALRKLCVICIYSSARYIQKKRKKPQPVTPVYFDRKKTYLEQTSISL